MASEVRSVAVGSKEAESGRVVNGASDDVDFMAGLDGPEDFDDILPAFEDSLDIFGADEVPCPS